MYHTITRMSIILANMLRVNSQRISKNCIAADCKLCRNLYCRFWTLDFTQN